MDPAAGPDPVNLPGLSLQIGDLQINQAQLGEMHSTHSARPRVLR